MRYLLSILLFFSGLSSFGANKYLRQGASGTASGDNWTDAYTTVAAAVAGLSRGDLLYVADTGSGTPLTTATFDKAASGSTVITVKKATASDHGTETGWNSSYGDGIAEFNNVWIKTHNWVFSGSTRNSSDWFNTNAYGFKITFTTENEQQLRIGQLGANAATNVTVEYTYIQGPPTLPSETIRCYQVDTEADWPGGQWTTGFVFRRNLVRHGNNQLFWRGSIAPLAEYNAFEEAMSNGGNHAVVINCYNDPTNAVIRFNQFRRCFINTTGDLGGGTAVIGVAGPTGVKIYGNHFDDFACGDGVAGFLGSSSPNTLFYNNTIVRGRAASGLNFGDGTGCAGRNNLWFDCAAVNFSIVGTGTIARDHNAYGLITAGNYNNGTEANIQTGFTSAGFINYAASNFLLADPTSAGDATLGAPYNTDANGRTRGADGLWDRGAYEYNSSEGGSSSTTTASSVTIGKTKTKGKSRRK